MNKYQKNTQLNKMVKFIDHDAKETEESIDILTEESYRKEKKKLLQLGTMQINQLYHKKIKLINRETATMISTRMTRAKLEISLKRENHIKSVLVNVNKELIKLRDNNKYYKQILEKLILQAMYQILEKEVNFILIFDDVKYVESIIDKLKNMYRVNTGMNVRIHIEPYIRLPIQEIGGVIITSKNRKKMVENTLVTRLLYLTQEAIPLIRCGLFGPNPTRMQTLSYNSKRYYTM